MLSVAEMESASADEPNVQAFARKVFQGQCATPVGDSDKKLWFGRVRQVLSAMQKSNSETTYECEPEQSWKDGLCSKGALAVTILNNHPRPNWWTLRSVDDRAFVLLHEWAHRYGPSVNQILETYCDAAEFGGLSAGDLVAEPDAYAGYIFDLVTGNAPVLHGVLSLGGAARVGAAGSAHQPPRPSEQEGRHLRNSGETYQLHPSARMLRPAIDSRASAAESNGAGHHGELAHLGRRASATTSRRERLHNALSDSGVPAVVIPSLTPRPCPAEGAGGSIGRGVPAPLATVLPVPHLPGSDGRRPRAAGLGRPRAPGLSRSMVDQDTNGFFFSPGREPSEGLPRTPCHLIPYRKA